MTQPLAFFDLDGTLADFDGSMVRQWMKIHPDKPYSSEHEREDDWEHASRYLIKHTPGFWRDLEPLSLGFAIFQQLKGLGFATHVLTAASMDNARCWMEKIEWCQYHLPKVPVTITRDKSIAMGQVLVDDWPEYIHSWLLQNTKGVAICPAQRWNIDIEKSSHRVIRVTNTEHDTKRIDQLLSRQYLI